MEIINSEDFLKHKSKLLSAIRKGAIFVYPTDTAYGIGCVIDNDSSLEKLRKIKGNEQPFPVIVPHKSWVHQNCHVEADHEEHMELLPGPYTLIFKQKNNVSKHITQQRETLAVRMPDHWITSFVSELGVPVVTTTIRHDDGILKHHSEMPDHIEGHVDYFIDEGEIYNGLSSIISLHKGYKKLR